MDAINKQDEFVLEQIKAALAALRNNKPEDRSEKARRYAVTTTEMEKVLAYFYLYVILE